MINIYLYNAEYVYIDTEQVDERAPIVPNCTLTPVPVFDPITTCAVYQPETDNWQLVPIGDKPQPEPVVIKTLTVEEKIAGFEQAIQNRLDDFARSGGRFYDNMISACTYATSTDPVYRVEGQYCVQARDETWATAYQVMNDVIAGRRPEPTWEELEAELPVLEWPVVE